MNLFPTLLSLLVVVSVAADPRPIGQSRTETCWEAEKGTNRAFKMTNPLGCLLGPTDIETYNFATVSASLINKTDGQEIRFNMTFNHAETNSISFIMTSEGLGQPIGLNSWNSTSFGGLKCSVVDAKLVLQITWVIMSCDTRVGSVYLLDQKVLVAIERRAKEGSNAQHVNDAPVVETATTSEAELLFPGESSDVVSFDPNNLPRPPASEESWTDWLWVGLGLLIVILILATISYLIRRSRSRPPNPT